MVKIYTKEQIIAAMEQNEQKDIIDSIEEGFVAYSQGKAVVPPVGELVSKEPYGETHIKYGYITGGSSFVIKIVSGFYDNQKLGLPVNSGLVLVFSNQTGFLEGILLDEGYLTDIRTAAAGAVVARYMAPKNIERIGVFGTGNQGRLQLEYLKPIVRCRDVIVWGMNQEELDLYIEAMKPHGFNIRTSMDAAQVAKECNLIVTATPSRKALLNASQLRKGAHITAIGSDTPDKQELDIDILQKADAIVSDSIDQSQYRGEIFQWRKSGIIDEGKIFELGNVIKDKSVQRQSDEETTVADLTGVAVQDFQISNIVTSILNKATS